MQEDKVNNESTSVSEEVLNDLLVAEEHAQQALGGAIARNNPLDDHNHGTHVSGTIGSMG